MLHPLIILSLGGVGIANSLNSVVKVGTGITLDATSGIVTATGVNVTGLLQQHSKCDGNATGLQWNTRYYR